MMRLILIIVIAMGPVCMAVEARVIFPACKVAERHVAVGEYPVFISMSHRIEEKALAMANGMQSGQSPAVGRELLVSAPLDAGMPEETRGVLRLQVALDRAGFVPGKIDGMDGKFMRMALAAAAESGVKLARPHSSLVMARVPGCISDYVDAELPGSGAAPDFKALSTESRRVPKYQTQLEFLAERWHSAEKLLEQLNPKVDFAKIKAGERLLVPNVEPFRIEEWIKTDGTARRSIRSATGKVKMRVEVSVTGRLLQVYRSGKLVAVFPVTVNEQGTPRGARSLGHAVTAPTYYRKKTGYDLLAGPNSPVGILWCPLGDGYGIHGTSDPRWIGRNSSAGCIRLANWDIVRFAAMVPAGAEVVIGDGVESEKMPDAVAER
jgi:lipoprotein-anchoring transpeptidase ErfK/SrfK